MKMGWLYVPIQHHLIGLLRHLGLERFSQPRQHGRASDDGVAVDLRVGPAALLVGGRDHLMQQRVRVRVGQHAWQQWHHVDPSIGGTNCNVDGCDDLFKKRNRIHNFKFVKLLFKRDS